MLSAPRVKICGLMRAEDSRSAVEVGADLIGLVLSDGFGRSVPLDRAAEVVSGAAAERVAVLVDETAAGARDRATAIGATIVQLHGDEDAAMIDELRSLGEWTVWKAVRARTVQEIHEVVDRLGSVVDGILVEGWREGSVGGAGIKVGLDAHAVRDAIPSGLTFVLAGGLTPDTVEEAVARFSPDVVDVSSGVETVVGAKDAALVEAFVRAAHGARLERPDS